MAASLLDGPTADFDEQLAEFEKKANRTANFMDRAIIAFATDPGFYVFLLALVVLPLMLLSLYLHYKIYKEEARDAKKNKGKRKARKAAMKRAAQKED